MNEQLQTIEPDSAYETQPQPTETMQNLGRLALLQDPEDPRYNDHEGNVVRGYN